MHQCGVEARRGNAADELRRVAAWCRASRAEDTSRRNRQGQVCGAGDRMDAEGAYGALCRGSRTLQVAGSLVKGIRREMGERPKRVRWGVITQQLREAMDKCLPHKSSPVEASIQASISRCAEVG